MDSSHNAQVLYDHALTKMGIKALRSNSIFTSSDVDQASSYGSTYIIFPVDGAEYSWTKNAKDLTLDTGYVVNDKFLNKLDGDVHKYIKKIGKEFVIYFDAEDEFYDDGIEGLIRTLKRIKYPNVNKVTMDALVDMQTIKTKYAPTNKEIPVAIKKGYEILVNGEYIAVKYRIGKDVLKILGISVPKW